MKVEVVIKNDCSNVWNNMAIKKAILFTKVDMSKIKKIYITDRIVNFVTE